MTAAVRRRPGLDRALRVLGLADVLMLASAMLFAADLGPGRAHGVQALLLVAWTLAPGAAAFRVRMRGWPRSGVGQAAAAAFLALTMTTLGASGWALLERADWTDTPLFVGTRLLILLVWCLGFLAFVPAIYRLQDFLCGGILLMAALEGRADPWLFVPLWLLGLTLSSASRHQVFDLETAGGRAGIDLRRGSALGLMLTVLLGGLFAVLATQIAPGTDDAAPDDRPLETGGPDGDRGRARRDERPAVAARTIGFPERMSLGEIVDARGDERTVFTVTELEPDGRFDPAGALWRVVALEVFDPGEDEWLEADESFHRYAWPRRGALRLGGDETAPTDAALLEIEIVMPVFRNLVRPYGVDRVWPPEPRDESSHYLVNADAVIVPQDPRLGVGTRYRLQVAGPVRAARGARARAARAVPAAWLAVPEDRALGFPLRDLAARVFEGALDLEEALENLQIWYRGSFRYDLKLDWLDEDDPRGNLGRFLLEARRGDCMYFATASVLLLRAVGVPARFCAGFVGASPVGEDGRWSVANARAHGWIEIPLEDGGWLPVDVTAWVDAPDLSPRLDEIAAAEAREDARLDLFPDLLLVASALASLLAFLLLGHRRTRGPAPVPAARIPATRGSTGAARALLAEYERLLAALARGPSRRRPGQTAAEHAVAMGARRTDLAAAARRVADLHDRTLYGEVEPDADELRAFRDACRSLRRALPRDPERSFMHPAPPLVLLVLIATACGHVERPSSALAATAWTVEAAEWRGLSLQTWNAVRDVVGPAADAAPGDGPRTAIVVDVDETVLDNAPYQARLVRTGTTYAEDTWAAWVEERRAAAMPGAVDALVDLAARGVRVFYVTNRDHALEAATRANLAAHGLPLDEAVDVVLTRGERPDWTSDKASRRAHVARDHRILALVGDDLADLVDGARTDAATRRALLVAHADRLGRDWFLLPNPVYGSWRDALPAAPTPDARLHAALPSP